MKYEKDVILNKAKNDISNLIDTINFIQEKKFGTKYLISFLNNRIFVLEAFIESLEILDKDQKEINLSLSEYLKIFG